MDFYKELDREFKNAGLKGRIVEVPPELRPTPEDFAELERKIAIRTHENEIMMEESIQYAKNSLIL